MSVEGITAFVTGASRGIGREIAVSFAEGGANVALAARSDGVEETAEAIEDTDGDALPVRTDVTDEESVRDSIEATAEKFGGLDCLVNNAGIAGPVEPFDRIDADDWDEVQEVNLRGPFLCAKHAAEYLRESERASIVNVSSVGGKRPYPNRSPYAASKMGLIGLTRTLAFELGGDGVTVNAVCPGAVQGNRINRAIQAQAKLAEEGVRTLNAEPDDTALQKLMVDKESVAEQVVFLAGERARSTTAQDLNVGGGIAWY